MRKIISLKDFLLTGEFGGLREDSTPSDVIEMFGEPTGVDRAERGIRILAYGWYEIAFWKDSPTHVMNDSLLWEIEDRTFENEKIKIDPWIFARPEPYTKPELFKILCDLNLKHRHLRRHELTLLQLENGVELGFDKDLQDPSRTVCHGIWMSFPEFRSNFGESILDGEEV